MPSVPSDFAAPGYFPGTMIFGQVNVAISQAQVALKINVNDATSGSLNLTDHLAPYAGSIVGITARLGANKTAGGLSVSPTINGTEVASTTPLYRVAMANGTPKLAKTVDAQTPGLRFNANDLIGARITTDSSFAPAGAQDIEVIVWVLYEGIQF
jgi:hypothetical protein